MERLLRARKNIAQNSKKGFTLVELIVVIVIIAILVAVLIPTIMGAITEANVVADQADARTLLAAASVAALDPANGGVRPISLDNLNLAINGQIGALNTGTEFTIHLDANDMPQGVSWEEARGPNAATNFIGTNSGLRTITLTIPASGGEPPATGAFTVTPPYED